MLLVLLMGFALQTKAESESNGMDSQATIVDLNQGEGLSMPALIKKMQAYDVILLGELHDNPAHHQARADLILSFHHPKLSIVAEHLPAGHEVMWSNSLLKSLESAGFDAKGWMWPIHEPLFRAVQKQNLPLIGGNISNTLTSDLFKRGEEAIPAPLLKTYKDSPLVEVSRNKLDQELKDSHCGQLPDTYLPAMRLIQRMKDSSFAQLLTDHTPSLLIAGDGHVRKDYGVPQIMALSAPNLKVLSIGFIEEDDWTPESQHQLIDRYDVVWITKNTERSDPCKDFAAPHLK